ncbi:MAG: exodeoxyribonuclease III [Chthonomonadaceae bacterium]|nr:exodeoxyribonuclease III [Chthonomonadaceae bacterium]
MTLATFNVNSIRARLPVLTKWLTETNPDVVALQETKVEDAKFPIAEIESAGYHVSFHGQPRYNGVALLSKAPIDSTLTGFEDPEWPTDCRIIAAQIGEVYVVNTYAPNGTAVGSEKYEYKLAWFEKLHDLLYDRLKDHENLVWLGDINVAPTDLDVFDPKKMAAEVCFTSREKDALKKLVDLGLTDCFRKFEQGGGHYSYWEYFIPNSFQRNLGWRIDHIYATKALADTCTGCEIDLEPRRWERPSDHTPVVASFDI